MAMPDKKEIEAAFVSGLSAAFSKPVHNSDPKYLARTYHHVQIWTWPACFTVAGWGRGELVKLRSYQTLQEAFDFACTLNRKHKGITLRGAMVEG